MKRGFTLIEVMMAAGIIGLGLLGLIALLAGAARLQQTSSQTSESVLIAKNAESLIRQSLASVTLNPTVASPIDTNRWYMVPKNDQFDHLELTDNVWPIAESTEATPYLLFDGGQDGTNPRIPQSSGLFTELRDDLIGFSHYAIRPESLLIRVRTIATPVGPDYVETAPQDFLYLRPATSEVWPKVPLDIANEEPGFLPYGNDLVRFYLDGDANAGWNPINVLQQDYITINVKHWVQSGLQASITDYRIADVANNAGRIIDEIAIERPYRYINTKLISLQDRMAFAADKTREDGRRPEFGFGVLYRTLLGGGSQAGVFIYGLQAPSRSAEWNPMETGVQIGSGDSPIAEVGQGAAFPTNVDLGFDSGGDEATDLYYLEVDEDFGWVVAPDQVVLVSWADSVGGGADDAVRVVRREIMLDGGNPTGKVRGYLERGPRHANHAMHDGGTGTESVEVWVVKDIAVSDEDGSTWRLRPLRFVAFQLDG